MRFEDLDEDRLYGDYLELVEEFGKPYLEDTYGLYPDSHWSDIIGQALLYGDIDAEGNLT